MARKGRRATFEEKVFVLRLLEGGMSPDRVADALGVGRESVFRWKRQARAGGVEALRIKKAPGRPRRLTAGQEQTVKAVVRDVTPRQVLGVAVALWTRALVAMVIAAWFGIGVSVAAAGRLLRGLGLSPQRPAYQALRRDPAAVIRWMTVLLPRICRLARAPGSAPRPPRAATRARSSTRSGERSPRSVRSGSPRRTPRRSPSPPCSRRG
ncbi:winged helix-turn-helix domain-containing protein [Streptosporangium sp. NBC_01495]|uniref:winged helix-turn-helix domain-containing protein n=1 Tax=Streptosporangium sp. NBC_01495 TaxID=2903899 RepID=UPI002E35D6B8|nr:winged helix-turn-helix domain-containing protein [Streptosporangium sp. NBC_01495]